MQNTPMMGSLMFKFDTIDEKIKVVFVILQYDCPIIT